jgi:hypothetical protein
MPKVQGLSKAEANYRKAENPKFSCHECALCSRGWRSADAAPLLPELKWRLYLRVCW